MSGKRLIERRLARETLGSLQQRQAEIEQLDGRTPDYPSEVIFSEAVTRLREHRCGGGRRVIRKEPKE